VAGLHPPHLVVPSRHPPPQNFRQQLQLKALPQRERPLAGGELRASGGQFGPILLKNSLLKFGRKSFGHEKAVAVEFLTATAFRPALVVKHFLQMGTF
jgi:hypothetical protein